MNYHINKFNTELIRQDFPILSTNNNGHKLIYLDNAATSQKPLQVIESITNFYKYSNANTNRGPHYLSEMATAAFDNARERVRKFINAKHAAECIFTKGTTEAINLVASSFGENFLQAGDQILLSTMEHHANIIPWQLLQHKKSIQIEYIPLLPSGELDLTKLDDLLTRKTKLISVTHVSNTLGTINPIKEIIEKAHNKGIAVLIDGAQAINHLPIDVSALNCDFYVFSAHKMFGPTGIGVLYGKKSYLDVMPPYQGGGQMIKQVGLQQSTYQEIPYKFEAGTQPIAEAIGLDAAINYINELGIARIQQHEKALLHYATEKLTIIPGLNIIGNANNKVGIISFILDKIHPHDIGTILNNYGIASRTGHLCTIPIMNFYKVPGLTRISFSVYNTFEEIDQLSNALLEVKKIFSKYKKTN